MTIPLQWRLMKIGQRVHRLMYAAGLGPLSGQIVLLLTTRGRKTRKRRVTPLQYEMIEGVIYVGSARGQQADWFRNILADPQVDVRVKDRYFQGMATPLTDPGRIADYLETRLQRHPRMLGAMMRMHKLPARPTRSQLEELAAQLAVVAIRPLNGNNE